MWYKEAQSNISIPADRSPGSDTKYVRQYNLENRQANHRKYYTIRVYDYEDGNYSVIAYSGRIGGNNPVVQPKGMYRSLSSAMDVAQSLARTKMNGGYRDQGDFTRTNISVGRPADASPTNPIQPIVPSRPSDAVFRAPEARSENTPPEQLEAALFNNNIHISLRCEVAENPATPPEALSRFVTEYANHPTPNEVTILTRIAKNPSTPSLALGTLLNKFYPKDVANAKSPSNEYNLSNISLRVIRNPNVPHSALRWVIEWEVANLDEPTGISEAIVESGKTSPITEAKWRIKFRGKLLNGNDKYVKTITALMDWALSSQKLEVQREVADLFLQSDYMNWTDNTKVEDFIDRLLSTEAFRKIALSKFPKEFFDRIRMSPQNREVVEQHFGGIQGEDTEMSIMKDLFAKNKNENWYKKATTIEGYAKKNKKDKIPLTSKERQEVKDKFGNVGCSFFRDKDGYYCTTHRARSDSYPSINKIPKSKVEFINSTC